MAVSGNRTNGEQSLIGSERLKLTPMRFANVPPPMALHEITLERNAIDVTVSSSIRDADSKIVVVAVLHREGYSLCRWSLDAKLQDTPSFSYILNSEQVKRVWDMMNLQIICGTKGSVICLSHNAQEASAIWILHHDKNASSYISQFGRLIEGIIRPGPNSDSTVYLVSDSNEVVGLDEIDLNKINKSDDVNLSILQFADSRLEGTSWRSEVRLPTDALSNSMGTPPKESVIFSLSENGSLFANERRLVRSCTSFLVTPDHLIFTTSQHLLKFVHLADDVDGKKKI